MAQLYGSDGPSADQQTRDYAPPEATFGSFWHGSRHVRTQPCSVESCSRSVLLPPVHAVYCCLLCLSKSASSITVMAAEHGMGPSEIYLFRVMSAPGLQAKRTWPYDMWSTGVVWLEMLLGTPHVFQAGDSNKPRNSSSLQGSRSIDFRHVRLCFRFAHAMSTVISRNLIYPNTAQSRAIEDQGVSY